MELELTDYLANFKASLKELKMCGDKVVEIATPTKKVVESFKQKVSTADAQTAQLLNGFNINLNTISLKLVNEQAAAAQTLKSKCPLFNIDALGGTDKSEMGILRTNISKLNLLLEASIKIKLIAANRLGKVQEKFESEDVSEISKLVAAINIITDSINKEVSTLNAQVGFLLAKEMEISSRLQTFETIISQLQKRFANAG